MSSLSFEGESGLLTSYLNDFYFMIKNGAISQNNSYADVTKGAKAEYKFNITTPGQYKIKMKLRAYHEWVNTVYVNIDADATSNIWTISPLTTGFEDRYVAWDGVANPKIFNLTTGQHTLVIRGHEPVAIDKITIEPASTSVPTSTGSPT
jgi:hypothetical protein